MLSLWFFIVKQLCFRGARKANGVKNEVILTFIREIKGVRRMRICIIFMEARHSN
jgi:hypothetical protein